MADIKKMFVHYSGTKADFASVASQYNNSIVFIKGGTTGESCIYTHGTYFANVKELVDSLGKTVSELKYFTGVKLGDQTYNLTKNGAGVLPFAANDTNTIDLNMTDGTLTFGLSEEFLDRIGDLEDDLGESNDASTADTAFGRIARLEKLIEVLGGDGENSIDKMIEGAVDGIIGNNGTLAEGDASTIYAINRELDGIDTSVGKLESFVEGLDASVSAEYKNDDDIYVKVTTRNGKVTDVSVDASAFIKKSDLDEVVTESSENVNGIQVSVTTKDGYVTDVSVDASAFVKTTATDTKSGKDEGIEVTVSTAAGNVSAVTVNASGIVAAIAEDLSAFDSSVAIALGKKADLDENKKILASQLPDFVMGQVLFGGTIDADGVITASANLKSKKGDVVSLPTAKDYEGVYFIATGDGSASGINYNTGDWVISTGSAWEKIDNTDAVSSVAGLAGAVDASELAAKLAATGDANELALKSEVEAVKVSASGETGDAALVNASVDNTGRAITVSTTKKLQDAVGLAESALQSYTVSKGEGIELTNSSATGVTVGLDSSSKSSLKLADSAVQDGSAGSDYVTVSKDGSKNIVVDLAESVKTSLGKADSALQSAVTTITSKTTDYLTYDVSKGDVNATVKVADTSTDNVGLVDNAGLKWALADMFAWEEL